MATNQKLVYVYDPFSSDADVLLGTFYVDVIRGGESYSFEYDSDWLKKTKYAISPDPALGVYDGRQYSADRNMFGMLADASPDRWGRILLNKRERITADKEKTQTQKAV